MWKGHPEVKMPSRPKAPPFLQMPPLNGDRWALPWLEWLRDIFDRVDERLVVQGTANEIAVTDNGNGTATIGIIDPLIVGKGGTGRATLTLRGLLLGNGTDALIMLGAATNGQIPIGSTGANPVLALITGTANQIISTPGAGSITLSAPQDIHTGASPTFAIISLTGIKIATGANAYMGRATLVAGTVTVANNHVKAATNIMLTPQDNNTTGAARISARIVDTSFTITSSNAGDTGEVAWLFADPV